MALIFLLLTSGALFLFFGGDFLVKGSSSFALRKGVTMLVVGLTIVSVGTSAPELFVSLSAQLHDKAGISVGNIIGSNIANIGLVLGLSALVRPVLLRKSTLRFDIPIVLISSIVLWAMAADAIIGRLDGLVFTVLFVGFLFYCYIIRHKGDVSDDDVGILKKPWMDWLYVGIGIAGLYLGAELFVGGAVKLATHMGMSEFFIGLSIVAIGTSLPELATSIIAAVKGNADISVGNVIGSNIFNILFVLGLVAMIKPLHCSTQSLSLDFPVMLGIVVLLWPLGMSGKISRRGGAILFTVYAVYIALIALRG